MFPVILLMVLVALPIVITFGAAFLMLTLIPFLPKAKTPVREDLDDMAAKVVQTAAQNRGYNSPTLAVVPVVGRVNAWHVVRKSQNDERIVTVWNLAMLHTLVLGHLVACNQ